MEACAWNPSYSGGWGRKIIWTREAEVAVSRDHTIALQPGRQEWDSVSKKKSIKNVIFRPGAMAHNPSTLGGWGERITWGQEFETSLANMVKSRLYQKYKNQPGVVTGACSPSYLEGWGGRITWAQEVKVAVSHGCTTALRPGWQSEINKIIKFQNK